MLIRILVLVAFFSFNLRTTAIAQEASQLKSPPEAEMAFQASKAAEKEGDIKLAIEYGHDMLALDEKALGKDHQVIAIDLAILAKLYRTQGFYSKAEPLYLRALTINEVALGIDHPDIAITLNNLAATYQDNGNYIKAEPLYLQALAIRERSLGFNHPRTATTLNNLAGLYSAQGLYSKAEPLYLRALKIREKIFGSDHSDTATSVNNLAHLYQSQGLYAQAEPLYLRAIEITEMVRGVNHPLTATIVDNLASLYRRQGSYRKAEVLFERSLRIREMVLGSDHPNTALSLNNLAGLYSAQGAYSKAEPLYVRALKINQTIFGYDHRSTGLSLNNLALVYKNQGSYEKAEPMLAQALSINETALGPDHLITAGSLSNLAELYHSQGFYAKAEPFYVRALAIEKKTLSADHPDTTNTMYNLAFLYEAQDRHSEAHKYFKKAAAVYERRSLLGTKSNSAQRSQASRELEDNADYFYAHAHAARLLSSETLELNGELLREAYSSAQYALRTSAGSALGQSGARFAATDDALADVVRVRQDLVVEWSVVNENLGSALGALPEDRDKEAEQSYRDRLSAIDGDVSTIDARLEADFPEYFTLTSPKPLGLEATQELLHGNEALVIFLSGDQGTLVFAVTRDKVAWSLVDMDASALSEAVRVLRVSLENPQNAFPRGQAHGLYKKLMSAVESLVVDKDHVFLVPSGALGSIPLGVLVTQEPTGEDRDPNALRQTSWWGTQQALTTLPSVSSLKALRLLSKDRRGNEAFAGFGNPVLEGPDGTEKAVQVASRGAGAYFRGRYADIEAVQSLSPLPQTEVELLSLAKAMKADPEDSLWLDVRATEANVKQADLSERRVLAFATHGLMSGEMSGLAEPALVFTPPDEATDLDDGLLTASEAALLNLNADWVILSACNTAAADEPGADGLSGLARSFFYAGARSMLVSHWPVRDDAAARLTTQAITLQDNDPDMGRAEALRRSMVLLMNDASDPSLAHPSAWAPFVIVGEGGSATSLRADENAILESKRRTSEKGLNLWLILSGLFVSLLALGVWGYKRREKFAN